MSVMTAILIGPVSAAPTGAEANELHSSAQANAAGMERETRIGTNLLGG